MIGVPGAEATSVPELKRQKYPAALSTKCSLFSLLHLHVCTASNFFTTILIYNWLFPPKIHCLRNHLPRHFRCALKTSSPHETLRWSENIIFIIILFKIPHISRLNRFALPWTSSNLYSKKEVLKRKQAEFALEVPLYGKHVRHSVFVWPWNKNGEQNVNHRQKQGKVLKYRVKYCLGKPH